MDNSQHVHASGAAAPTPPKTAEKEPPRRVRRLPYCLGSPYRPRDIGETCEAWLDVIRATPGVEHPETVTMNILLDYRLVSFMLHDFDAVRRTSLAIDRIHRET